MTWIPSSPLSIPFRWGYIQGDRECMLRGLFDFMSYSSTVLYTTAVRESLHTFHPITHRLCLYCASRPLLLCGWSRLQRYSSSDASLQYNDWATETGILAVISLFELTELFFMFKTLGLEDYLQWNSPSHSLRHLTISHHQTKSPPMKETDSALNKEGRCG